MVGGARPRALALWRDEPGRPLRGCVSSRLQRHRRPGRRIGRGVSLSVSSAGLHGAPQHQASLDRAMQGDDLERLVADFNRDWPEVTRTRELLVLAQAFETS